VLLDLGLPGRGGLEVLTAIRRLKIRTPVGVLTARDMVSEHIARLRRKVDVDESEGLIHTVRGVGFMLHVGEP
jgi:DNA-binding response OmpR family regulator